MGAFERSRIQRVLGQNQTILAGLLDGLSAADALAATDGPDGWSVTEIVCHLRDMEASFRERLEQMLREDHPVFAPADVNAWVIERNYKAQDLRAVHDDLRARRGSLIALLPGLDEAQWNRTGVHPRHGEQTVEQIVFQIATHDIDHLDQITRALGRADRFP
jgi:uncharacterized damage-inducible protein DinB